MNAGKLDAAIASGDVWLTSSLLLQERGTEGAAAFIEDRVDEAGDDRRASFWRLVRQAIARDAMPSAEY